MKTAFAPAERKSGSDLNADISFVCQSPLLDGLMESVGGLMAVLNEERQVLALNTHLLNWMGIKSPENLLGLRPGELLHCKHAVNETGGCGTTESCRTCGAAIAIVTVLASNQPAERTCALSLDQEHGSRDLFLRVQANPLTINDRKFLLLFLQDISDQHRLAALERVFFHDIRNLLGGLTGVCEVIGLSNEMEEIKPLAVRAQRISRHLAREIDMQDFLATSLRNHRGKDTIGSVGPTVPETITPEKLFKELEDQFAHHRLNHSGLITFTNDCRGRSLSTDPAFVLRILGNMITNALEAGDGKNPVRVGCQVVDERIRFSVWNQEAIPPDVTVRIFQRHFSTKKEFGRGLGTYSMKLFGEEILGGKVGFSTSSESGTTFSLLLPLKP